MEVWSFQESFNRGIGSMNGDEQGPTLNDFTPSWMRDGDLSGGSEEGYRFNNDDSYILKGTVVSAPSWDTTTTSQQNQNDDTPAPRSCLPDSPPESGTSVWGSIDGECQWIDTTTCS